MLVRLLFALFSVFAVLSVATAAGHTHQAMPGVQGQLASDDDDGCCYGLVLYFAEDDRNHALAEFDGEDGVAIQFRHGLPPEEIDAAGSPDPSRFNLLRARTSAPRAPPAQA